MTIKRAEIGDLERIEFVTRQTINAVYPKYYPTGAVNFFLAHHNTNNIAADINAGIVFAAEYDGIIVGTVTVHEDEICRLFVLPEYQGKGLGGELLDFAEKMIAENYDKITLSASLPAKKIYLKRGYREVGFDYIQTENGDFLCYDTMEKNCVSAASKISYDGRIFTPKENSENGEVDGRTVFNYHQSGSMLWAEYSGGEIVKGHLLGTAAEDGALDFHYQHINTDGQVRIGQCHSVPILTKNGKIELHETWQWLNGSKSYGNSVIIEL